LVVGCEKMKRIMIIGCGGSGKSTLATQLGQRLSLPVHHLDRLFWQPRWTELPKDEWRKMQERLCAEPEWILDGNYGGTMDVRFAAADTIIFLDFPTLTCLIGAFRRFLKFRGRTRPDMTEGCPERLEWPYLKWIWTYRRDRRPKILCRLDELKSDKTVIILTSRSEIRTFLNGDNETANQRLEDIAANRAESSA
jgi:adenylate kinase family enzyme